MKITIVNGQNHKGSTWNIGNKIVQGLGKDNEIIEFFLPNDFPHFCVGCTTCIMEDIKKCPHFANLEPILKAIDQSDLIIFTTPTYVYHASASMKALLDHLSWRWMSHRPEPSAFTKQAVVISTSAGSTTKYAIKDIKHSLTFWGIGKIYTFGIAVSAANWEEIKDTKLVKINQAVSKIVRQIQANDNKVKPSLFQRLFFWMMRGMQKKPWNKTDGDWWRQQGYLDGRKPWKQKATDNGSSNLRGYS